MLESATRLGPYEILSPLGAGGMGEVYRARDVRLGREVAVKLLPESLSGDEQALERFRREARAASALSHPGICTVHDVAEEAGRPFIVMELLEGHTLREILREGALPTEKLLDLAVQMADALNAASVKGIVHRDLKPGNVFVTTRGQAKLLDFGLATLDPAWAASESGASASPTEERLTSPGTALGTVAYMFAEAVTIFRNALRGDRDGVVIRVEGARRHQLPAPRPQRPGPAAAAWRAPPPAAPRPHRARVGAVRSEVSS